MTVEFVPARLHLRNAPRKRLSLPDVLLVSAIAAWVACATSACSDRGDDARVALTTSAARELAQTQPMPALSATSAQQPGAAPLAGAFSTPSNLPDSANGSAITAQVIRSPARAAAPDSASGADSFSSTSGAHVASDAPLAPPEIHTAD
ncbi:hypothetical protein [Paraburkholderia bannensis]|uniref:hypothetical protein n=1 Tax=Paraburkholderia bannensis TaxID=765414 RepID=UPI0004808895|nr:hypothetical protein [Paraburkholderia bannensis]